MHVHRTSVARTMRHCRGFYAGDGEPRAAHRDGGVIVSGGISYCKAAALTPAAQSTAGRSRCCSTRGRSGSPHHSCTGLRIASAPTDPAAWPGISCAASAACWGCWLLQCAVRQLYGLCVETAADAPVSAASGASSGALCCCGDASATAGGDVTAGGGDASTAFVANKVVALAAAGACAGVTAQEPSGCLTFSA